MYGKHFSSMYEGSMVGAGAHVFAVWGYCIANADPDLHTVRLNAVVLSVILGEPKERINDAIKYLCAADEDSCCTDAEGRRLINTSGMEYLLVTHEHHRNIKNSVDRREYMRKYMREYRKANKDGDNREDVNICKLVNLRGFTSASVSVSESVFEGGSAEGGILVAGMSITEATAAVRACHPDFARAPEMAVTNALRDVVRDGELTEDGAKRINDMALHYAGASMRKPIGHLVNYLNHRDRKAMTGGSDLTEYKRTEAAVAEAMWDTLDLKPTKDELRRAIKALHDKYRDTPKSEAGKDPVEEGINRAMNNKRKRK